ncbi:hypothetical protein [Gloeobacter morelensis]|uniref:Uncharacterized protein n=1 Tax=Gloeobacter morelensis MG652769 TaxID=2781736 RepID=A0ABY3PP07_9CYAN|nr:hypothetical protein [Gloeobacter morelensis]UFP95435.1 hypothetical protein ISF26_04075 [Gloeobacter morelensis MG652769]
MSYTQQLAHLSAMDYVVVGVALCYQKNAEGKTDPVRVVEPIPATALEAMSRGNRTSYLKIYATTLGAVIVDQRPVLPTDILGEDAYVCHDFLSRTQAAARTYKAKSDLRLVPVGEVCTPEVGQFRLHYDPAFRRILGGERLISDSDNIKQHSHTHKTLV